MLIEMLDEGKEMLLEGFLYPTKSAKIFMEGELYENLSQIIPEDKIFAHENLLEEVRDKNFWNCVKIIGNYLYQCPEYLRTLKKIYEGEPLLTIFKLVLLSFVYRFTKDLDMYSGINFTTIPECIVYGQNRR